MRKASVLIAIMFIALLGALALAPMLEQPPALRMLNAQGSFDAKRAEARLSQILGDQRAHWDDSSADDLVRTRLVSTLDHMGLKPLVRDQFACNVLFKQRGVSCARVRNVIAQIGPSSGRAVLINAHYDSVAAGPGASDDGIGVATMLEVGSILEHQTLRRPVVLLFNEGEELGLIGARAFLSDPLSTRIDSLINLEARGVEGPVNMFETNRPNFAAISLFSATVGRPSANSLSTDVYRLMPNYTDVNSFAERNWLTLNLAPIGNETRYHSAGDELSALSPATLQHMGDQTLALAQRLANEPSKSGTTNRIFMDVSGRLLITMPLGAGIAILVGLVLIFTLLAFPAGQSVQRVAIVVGTFLGSAILSWLLLALVEIARPGMFWRAHPIFTHLITYAAVLLVGGSLVGRFAPRCSVRDLRSMFWLFFLSLGVLIGFVATGGIIFFLFPPLLILIGLGIARWWKPAEAIGSAAAILFLYLTWGAMLGLLEELLNDGPMWIFAPLGSLILIPVLIEAKPLLVGARLPAIVALGGVIVGGCSVAALAAPAYSNDRQQRFTLEYVTDVNAKRSWWAVLDDGAKFPPAFGNGWKIGKLPISGTRLWNRPAPFDLNVQAPSAALISQVVSGGERTLLVRLSANGNDSIELVAPEDAKIRSAGVQNFVAAIEQNETGKYAISCTGRSCNGVTLQITTGDQHPVPFMIIGVRYVLPGFAEALTKARPRFARPQYRPDESLTFVRSKL